MHEIIRKYSIETANRLKEGETNNLIQKIADNPKFKLTMKEIQEMLEPQKFIGRSVSQVEEFIVEYVNPNIEKNKNVIGEKDYLKV